MPDSTTNGWNEWSRHVLAELKRLNDNWERLHKDVTELRGKMSGVSGEELTILKVQVLELNKKDEDQENRLRLLEKAESTFKGKWMILSVIGAALVSVIIGFVFTTATAKPEHKNDRESTSIEQTTRP